MVEEVAPIGERKGGAEVGDRKQTAHLPEEGSGSSWGGRRIEATSATRPGRGGRVALQLTDGTGRAA